MSVRILIIIYLYEFLYNSNTISCNCCYECCHPENDINFKSSSNTNTNTNTNTKQNKKEILNKFKTKSNISLNKNINTTNKKCKFIFNTNNKTLYKSKNYFNYDEKLKEEVQKFNQYNKYIENVTTENICSTVSNHKCCFHNIGNSCYMNSLLHFILKIETFVKSIIEIIRKCDHEKLGSKPVTLELFYLIVKIYNLEKKEEPSIISYNDLKILQNIILYKDFGQNNYLHGKLDFLDGKQSDPEEFIRVILEDLENENKNENCDFKQIKISIKDTLECIENKNHKHYAIIDDYILKINIPENIDEIKLLDLINNNKEKLTEREYADCTECTIESNKNVNGIRKNEEIKKILYECNTCKDFYESEAAKNIKSGFFSNLIKKNNEILEANELNEDKIDAEKQSIYNCQICNNIYNSSCEKCRINHQKYCDQKNKNMQYKILELHDMKEYLIIQIARYIYKTKGDKILTKIPLEEKLTLNLNNKNINLNLESIIYHYGHNLNYGHYVAYKKIKNKWYLFDDSKYSEIDLKNKTLEDIEKNCYILLYKKQNN